MGFENLPQYLNIAGLICDAAGVIMLFRRLNRFGKLDRHPDVRRLTYIASKVGLTKDPITEGLKQIVKDINNLIKQWENTNEKNHKTSVKWIGLICLGFALQLGASIIQLVH